MKAHGGDRYFHWILQGLAALVVLLLVLIVLELIQQSWPALQHFGGKFLSSRDWDPVNDLFGALPFIFGTVVSSLLALIIALPVSLGVALFLNEMAPPWIATPVGFLIEMLAAIPSVVFGIWGIFVLAPWLRTYLEPALAHGLGFIPLFQGPAYGVGMLAAGVILAIMITPTISTISREVFKSVPDSLREAALGLGATRWETIRIGVLANCRAGIFSAMILGLGRAIGETMAVTMVIGNRPEISWSLFDPGQTMASVIANEYAEATSSIHLSSLAYIGLALFGVSLLTSTLARLLTRSPGKKEASK